GVGQGGAGGSATATGQGGTATSGGGTATATGGANTNTTIVNVGVQQSPAAQTSPTRSASPGTRSPGAAAGQATYEFHVRLPNAAEFREAGSRLNPAQMDRIQQDAGTALDRFMPGGGGGAAAGPGAPAAAPASAATPQGTPAQPASQTAAASAPAP